MKRRRLHLCALMFLPLLAVRAFVPSGFMLAAGSDGLNLVFCQPGALQGAESALAAHAPGEHSHHHPPAHHEAGLHDSAEHLTEGAHGSGEHNGGLHVDAPCPFALVGATLAESVPHDALARPTAGPPIGLDALPAATAGPARAQRIRGPPLS